MSVDVCTSHHIQHRAERNAHCLRDPWEGIVSLIEIT